MVWGGWCISEGYGGLRVVGGVESSGQSWCKCGQGPVNLTVDRRINEGRLGYRQWAVGYRQWAVGQNIGSGQ